MKGKGERMKKIKRILILFALVLTVTFSATACGNKPVTEKQLEEANEDMEKGKISQAEYWEIYDAYWNGDPMPNSGGGFFSTVGKIIVFCVVVGGVVVVIKKYKNKK